ncbi:MAG: DUF4271 domain-containing protein [Cryomorphaceae bacterium]|nr:MAG: DUF4271 domain-containing protein [Cryomorphaceae bacterium]
MDGLDRIQPFLQEDWMLALLLVVLVGLAFIRYAYPRRLHRLVQALLRVRILLQLMREEMVLTHHTALILFLSFSATSALLLYLAAHHFGWAVTELLGPALFPVFFGLVTLVYAGKIVVVKTIQVLFLIQTILWEYLNYTFVVNALLGIAWIPLLLIALVSSEGVLQGVLYSALGIFALGWLVRVGQGIMLAFNQRVPGVYIILYLCALEILPLMVLARWVLSGSFEA